MPRRRKAPDSNPKRAVIYLRVSTEEQVEEGISLETQEAMTRAHCLAQGLEVAAVITDPGVSASKPLRKRPGGHKLLETIKKTDAGVVVATKLDRLFRSVLDCLGVVDDWRADGVGLALLDLGGHPLDTGNAMGSMFLTIVAAFAEMERRLISERTAAALATKRAKGEPLGRVPYGQEVGPDGLLRPQVEEQETLADMRRWRADGCTLRAITDALVTSGTPPPRARKGGRQGTRWHLSTVHELLKRPPPTPQDPPS